MISQVSTVKFGILSDNDILKMSVCEISNPSLTNETGTVYDNRLGCVKNNTLCTTCNEDIWKCPGHFGHIEMNIPIILFYKQCVPFLKCFCFNCHRILCTVEELRLNKIVGFDRIVAYVSDLTICARCQTPHPEIRFNISDSILEAQHKYKNTKASRVLTPSIIKLVFDDIPDSDVQLLGIDIEMFHPRNLVLTKFLVLPTCCRPRMITASNSSDDDLTLMLVDIIKNNNIIGKLSCVDDAASSVSDGKRAEYDKAVANIKFKTLAYRDNSKGKAKHNTNHKDMTGITERITKKSGIVRQNLMGKRCDKTARTVVGPDPTLKLDEVAIPEEVANSLTIPEYVNYFNINALTELVNDGRASCILKPNGTRVNVSHAAVKRGTQLCHGDVIVKRDGSRLTVTNCKMVLADDDRIFRNGDVEIENILSSKRRVTLNIGDKVERYLRDGDPLLLNRQPTLHRNSMQGMRVVVKKGKTIRVNLAIVNGFNMDFDGDEGNIFDLETLEAKSELLYISNAKKNILSAQLNKPEMVIVQDSLLGAYKMTVETVRISRSEFFNCLLRTNAFDQYPDWQSRLAEIRAARGESADDYTCHALFGFILPSTFHMRYPIMTIRNGIIVDGYFDKTILKGTQDSIIRILCLEYGEEVASVFIDNIQFLTNGWLESCPFSVGISDCIIGCRDKHLQIKQVVNKYFLEADQVSKTTDVAQTKEFRVNCSLNKAKDLGLKIAKEALKPDNNFISTVSSGSKGDYFNIAQITGLLGQQNLSGSRPVPTLDNRTRTMIHYPPVIQDIHRKYESRGFVASSFMGGMNPKEMFFHAMTGREGMISTAMGTASSGYIQRSCVKLNEDLKIAYDGTVRDASNNIFQYAYGNHGFDPCKVTFRGSDVYPVDIERLAEQLSRGDDAGRRRPLVEYEIDDIVDGCRWKCQIPRAIFERIWSRHERLLRLELSKIRLCGESFERFKSIIVERYHTCRASPGDSVGIISAQSIGEKQTQINLNTFHTAGKLQHSGVGRLEEILNMSKTLKVRTNTVYFKEAYKSAKELRDAVGSTIACRRFSDLVVSQQPTINLTDYVYELSYELDADKLFIYRVSPVTVVDRLKSVLTSTAYDVSPLILADGRYRVVISVKSTLTRRDGGTSDDAGGKAECCEEDDECADADADADDCADDGEDAYADVYADDDENIENTRLESLTLLDYRSAIDNCIISGIEGINSIHLDNNDGEWYIVTDGSNMKKLLAHKLVDTTRLYSNDLWEVYECLGISKTREIMFDDLKKVVNGVNDLHIQILVDKMTNKGRPMALTRYTMRTNDVGPLSKATFEESINIIISAAIKTEIEHNNGVSAAIISGNQPKIGTGMMNLKIDYEKFLQSDVVADETIQQSTDDVVVGEPLDVFY